MNNLLVAPLHTVEVEPAESPRGRNAVRPRPNARAKILGLALVALVFLSGVVVVAQTARLNALGYRLAQVRGENLSLERTTQKLELEVARLKDPSRLAQLAQDRLGLVEPDLAHVRPLPVASLARAEAEVGLRPGAELAQAQEPTPLWRELARAVSRWLGPRVEGQSALAGD